MMYKKWQIEKEVITHFIGFETLVSSASVGEWLGGMFHGKSSWSWIWWDNSLPWINIDTVTRSHSQSCWSFIVNIFLAIIISLYSSTCYKTHSKIKVYLGGEVVIHALILVLSQHLQCIYWLTRWISNTFLDLTVKILS